MSEELSNIIYFLSIEDNGRPKIKPDEILSCEHHTTVHIELYNGTPITNEMILVSNAKENFPYGLIENEKKSGNVDRTKFTNFTFDPIENDTIIIYEIKLDKSGPVEFAFIYFDKNENKDKITEPFYIIVQPDIFINKKRIDFQSIHLQTILSKSLGKINEFDKFYEEASKLKYNFIHFTPIQKLGISESLYCIRDNTEINDIFFEGEVSKEEKLDKFKESLDKCRDKYGMGSIVDIVLNHAADNSDWLAEHPECGYNLVNTPWLNCAYSLDKVLGEFSDRFCECKSQFKFQPYVHNDEQLNQIMNEVRNIVFKKNLHEYFNLNIGNCRKLMEEFYDDFSKDRNKYQDDLNKVNIHNDGMAFDYLFNQCLDKLGEERNGVIVLKEKFGCALVKLYRNNLPNKNDFLNKCENLMKGCNDRWNGNVKNMLELGIKNIRDGIHYEFIQCHNKAEKRKKPLISRYFAVFDENDKNKIFACNGWIMESDDPNEPTPNFTKKGSYYYFKRKVMIWSDCPKLNYGTKPEDCPYLMEHMTKYVQDMAKMFNGFRLDNAHSTPIHVGEYLAMKAREVNPDLLIIAELFTTKENEINFVTKIGINLLIRELIWSDNPEKIASQIHRFGGGYDSMLGKLSEDTYEYKKNGDDVTLKKMKYLLPCLPKSIIFDLTHDNETYLQRMNNLGLNLTQMACNALAATAIGSTRGYDQLFPIQPSVVNESRKYVYDDNFINICKEEDLESGESEEIIKENEEKEEEKKEEDNAPFKKIKFEYKGSNLNNVSLALSSRGWKPDIKLNKTGHDTYSIELDLENHQRHFYKYVLNNNNWVYDNNKPHLNDGKGNINNFIDVGMEGKQKEVHIKQGSGKSYHVKDLKLFRRAINKTRNDISKYSNEFFLHRDGNYICVFRTFCVDDSYIKNQPSYDGYALICRTGFDGNSHPAHIELPGLFTEFVCACSLKIGHCDIEAFKKRNDLYGTDSDVYFTKNPTYLNSICKIYESGGKTVMDFNNTVQPHTSIIIRFKSSDNTRNALVNIDRGLKDIYANWKDYTKNLDICDVNLILYKCEKEELDNTKGKRGCYGFDNWGSLVYAGIAHLHKMLNQFKITKENHVILDNIRAGDWLLKYSIDRYSDQPNIKDLYNKLSEIFSSYTKLYVHQKPIYITKIIDAIYNIVMERIILKTNEKFLNLSPFCQQAAATVHQFLGYVESSRFKFNTDKPWNKLSMSAGLPHFTTEYLRSWGRDTFISFKGLMLIPGYFEEAKAILLQYAAVMRHGLLPNLFDSGVNSRFNARDATWFFTKSAIDYIEMSGDYDVLNEEVNMVFLSDNFDEHNNKKKKGESKKMTLSDILHHIIQQHASGINFREWRAGKDIDEQMTNEGFNIKIYLNKDNGFIFGGNKWNCGTWMDKMGSSEKAGNKGHPGSPRNGADVEIIALLYFTLSHLDKMNQEGKYKYNTVKLNDGTEWTYAQWSEKIKENFDKCFYIEHKNEHCKYDGTYKDYISDDNDFRHEAQLRCNVYVAMATSPELFNVEHGRNFMRIADEHLYVKGAVGVRTLDNTDKNYNGNYINSDDSNDYHKAHGLNYHNGPEWVWPAGYALIAKMIFNDCESKKDIFKVICERLVPMEKYVKSCKWEGLPELTNKDGAFCNDSCTTQAWSIGTVIEALFKLTEYQEV